MPGRCGFSAVAADGVAEAASGTACNVSFKVERSSLQGYDPQFHPQLPDRVQPQRRVACRV